MQIETRIKMSEEDLENIIRAHVITEMPDLAKQNLDIDINPDDFTVEIVVSDKPKQKRAPRRKKATPKTVDTSKDPGADEPDGNALEGIPSKDDPEPTVLTDKQTETLQELYDELVEASDRATAKAVLTSVGFKSIPHVSPESYDNVLEALRKDLERIAEADPDSEDDDDDALFGDDASDFDPDTSQEEEGRNEASEDDDDEDEELFGDS